MAAMASGQPNNERAQSDLLPAMTVNDAIEEISNKGTGAWVTRALIALALNSCVVGIETNVTSYISSCAQASFKDGAAETPMIASAVFAGQIVGSLVLTPLADIYGRRRTLMFCSAGIAVFATLSALSPSVMFLIVTRGITGFFEGPWMVAIDFITEFVPAERRGVLTNYVSSILWGLGTVVINLVAWATIPTYGWRAPVLFTSFLFAIDVGLIYRLVESPRWLVSEGRLDDAMEALAYMAGVNETPMPCSSLVPMRGHESDHSPEGNSLASLPQKTVKEYTGLFKSGTKLYVVATQWLLWGFAYQALVLYDTDVLGHVKKTKACSFHYGYNTFIGSAELVGGFLMMPLLDRPELLVGGRRGSQVMAYALATFGIVMTVFKVSPSLLWSYTARGLVCAGTGVANIQGAELFEVSIRATATGFLNAINQVGSFVSPYWVDAGFSPTVNGLGIACSVLAALVFTLLIEETAGVELDAAEDAPLLCDVEKLGKNDGSIDNCGKGDPVNAVKTDFSAVARGA